MKKVISNILNIFTTMKKFYSCFIILTFFSSCAHDENTPQDDMAMFLNKDGVASLPANNANPYDNAGRIYDELFNSYYDGTTRSTALQSVIEKVEEIAANNASFDAIDSGHQRLSPERIQYLANLGNSDIAGIVGSSSLSAIGKTSFSNFVISISALFDVETDAAKMAEAVVKYETSVLRNDSLTLEDKRIILTTTSIMRYTSYRAKKKPKKNTDPYWNIWVTHVFGSEEGAEENMEKAILQGLVACIVSNK